MQWEWESDDGDWTPYNASESVALDSAYVRGEPFELLQSSTGGVVTFERLDGLQVNIQSGVSRPVRRVSRALWEARLELTDWVAYESTVSSEIEDAFAARSPAVIVQVAIHGIHRRAQPYRILFGPADGLAEGNTGMRRVRRTNVVLPASATETVNSIQSSLPGRSAMAVDLTVVSCTKQSLVEKCSICLDETTTSDHGAVQLIRCGHEFHGECIRKAFESRPTCPLCKTRYAVITGNMPQGGSMIVRSLPRGTTPVSGFESEGTIIIQYRIPSGVQGPTHPSPGTEFSGTIRLAFLPDIPEGREVLQLLQVAWERKLTFTVGRSLTTGRDHAVVWNGIHHKTCPEGGTSSYGWPDPQYFERVKAELAEFGIE